MQFPVYIGAGPVQLHPHTLFELLAYFVGFRLYLWQRRRRGDVIGGHDRWSVVAAAAVGAAAGSKLLVWLEDPAKTLTHLADPIQLLGGKSVVGALLGGLLAVEAAKRLLGITRRTGDLFALPLAVGIAIGRVGCFLTGPSDLTWGLPTRAPWGIDPGTGVPLHPAPLYEIAFLVLLAVALVRFSRDAHPEGSLFRAFMIAYLAFRLGVDALKGDPPLLLGLGAIQWACALALVYYAVVWTPAAGAGSRLTAHGSRKD